MVGPVRTSALPSQQAPPASTSLARPSMAAPASAAPPPPTPGASSSTAAAAVAKLLTPRRASCEFCRKRKIRCNGEEPCSACIQRKLTCVFERESRKGRPPRSSKPGQTLSPSETDGRTPPGSVPINPSARTMLPTRSLSAYKTPHTFDIQPEDISTPFWVQLGGKQGTVAHALQDFWDRYFSPKDHAPQPASEVCRPAEQSQGSSESAKPEEHFSNDGDRPGGTDATNHLDGDDAPTVERQRKDHRFPQTTFDSADDESHWVATFSSTIRHMIQGMVELSCNVYSQLGCTWIGKPFFFVYMMQQDPTQRMFDGHEPGTNPLDEMSLDYIIAMVEIFFAHNALAAIFSKSMIIEQCKEYMRMRSASNGGGTSSTAYNTERLPIPPPSELLITTLIAEAIPDSIEDEEDDLVVEAANQLRLRLQHYAESLLFSTSVEPATVKLASSEQSSRTRGSSSTSSNGPEDDEEADTLYDLSTIQALVLIGGRELCEGTSPRKAACYVGVVARMLSHMRAKERAAPQRRKREEERMFTAANGPTYRAVNEEIRINLEWFITAIAAWFFCQLERPLGQILPPASILRFPPLRICRSASLQMDKRRSNIISLRRQAQLVEQLWTCATVTVTVCLIHDLHPSSQERQRTGSGQQWQEEHVQDLHDLGKPKHNMLELCERIQRYLDDYLKDMQKNKAPPTALAFLEASFMAIYVHTLFPTMTDADINWNTGVFFRKHTFDLFLAAAKRILAALEPWANTSRTRSSREMFSRRHEDFQTQLSDIFVLALDAVQRALRVIVDYIGTPVDKCFRSGDASKDPPRTTSGWLMPTREVLDYVLANLDAVTSLAEQAQLASASTFLRVGLHARRVEEGFTYCLCTLRERTASREEDPASKMNDAVPSASQSSHTVAGGLNNFEPPSFSFLGVAPGTQSAGATGSANASDGQGDSSVTRMTGMMSTHMPDTIASGNAAGAALGPAFADLSSFVSPPSVPRGSTTSPAAQPFSGGDDPLSTLWWNQQASALPLSLPTVTGMENTPVMMRHEPLASFPLHGLPLSSPSDGAQSRNLYDADAGTGAFSSGAHSAPAPSAALSTQPGGGSGGPPDAIPMGGSAWANATIPDSWLAAAFYDNMEVLRSSGFTMG